MNSLAICIFGNGKDDISTIKNTCTNVFADCDITFFYMPNDNEFKSLWLTSNQKRQYELDNKKEFNLCMAIKDSGVSIIGHLKIKPCVEDDVLYFSNGKFDYMYYSTEVTPNGFYANSATFDRVAEFIFTKINQINLRVDNIGTRFYFHLKYLKIKTECINYENSHLFKRPT